MSSTTYLSMAESFTASSGINDGGHLSPNIDSWGKQLTDSLPQIGKNYGADPFPNSSRNTPSMGYILNLKLLISWLT